MEEINLDIAFILGGILSSLLILIYMLIVDRVDKNRSKINNKDRSNIDHEIQKDKKDV